MRSIAPGKPYHPRDAGGPQVRTHGRTGAAYTLNVVVALYSGEVQAHARFHITRHMNL